MSAFHYKAERQKCDFSKDLIGSTDEMPIYFNIENKGAKEVSIKATRAEKRRVTTVLVCLASGKTLSPIIIFKGKSITQQQQLQCC